MRSSIEMCELQILLDGHGLEIPYEQTYHARRFAESYMKTVGPIIDYSSLGKEVSYNLNTQTNKNKIMLNIAT